MDLEEKLGFDVPPAAMERIEQPSLKKKLIIALEVLKRVFIIAFIYLTILAATGGLDRTIAEQELIHSDAARQILVNTTNIADIKIKKVNFNSVCEMHITPSSESMAVYADAEPGSDEATVLLFKMRRLCFVANNEKALADLAKVNERYYACVSNDRYIKLIAGDHEYYYQQPYLKEGETGCEPELLKIDGNVIYSRMSKG